MKLLNAISELDVHIGAPVLIGRYLARASWMEISNASCVWFGICLIVGVLMGGPIAEKLGLAFYFAMFYSILAMPIMIWAFRALGFRLRWFAD